MRLTPSVLPVLPGPIVLRLDIGLRLVLGRVLVLVLLLESLLWLLLTWGVIDIDLAVVNELDGGLLLYAVLNFSYCAISAEAWMG